MVKRCLIAEWFHQLCPESQTLYPLFEWSDLSSNWVDHLNYRPVKFGYLNGSVIKTINRQQQKERKKERQKERQKDKVRKKKKNKKAK